MCTKDADLFLLKIKFFITIYRNKNNKKSKIKFGFFLEFCAGFMREIFYILILFSFLFFIYLFTFFIIFFSLDNHLIFNLLLN